MHSIGSVHNPTGGHAQHVGNNHPSAVGPAAYGCGDAVAWQHYEAGQDDRERLHVRMERVTPHDASLPDGLKPPPYPWQVERQERLEIARQCVDDGLRGVEVDQAIDLTVFARRFERWAEEGFQMKG